MSDDAPQIGGKPVDNSPGLPSEWAKRRSEESSGDPLFYSKRRREASFAIRVSDDGVRPEQVRQRIEDAGLLVTRWSVEYIGDRRVTVFQGVVPDIVLADPAHSEFMRGLVRDGLVSEVSEDFDIAPSPPPDISDYLAWRESHPLAETDEVEEYDEDDFWEPDDEGED